MRIGFSSPYLDSIGGGERYMLTLAAHWSLAHDVSLFWDDAAIVQKAKDRLNIDLSRVKVVPNIFVSKRLFGKLAETRKYDLLFFLTDGSIPTSLARYNMLHFQVPFARVPYHPLKMSRFQWIVTNSDFTKTHIDPRLQKKAIVIYPPVDLQKAGKKEKLILSVGRFNGHYSVKKQDVLIAAWKQAVKQKSFAGWKLVFAGGMLPSDEEFVDELRRKAKGATIEFAINIPYKELASLYEKASIYWHAAGFGETKPEHMEHFGITTVEAMSAGAVPIVYDAGGQQEIIADGKNGYLWKTREELIARTGNVITHTEERSALAKQALVDAKQFDEKHFCEAFDKLIVHLS